MRSWIAVPLVAAIAGLVTVAAMDNPAPTSSGRAFSAVPLRPAVVQALRASGKTIKHPVPAAVNRGRKFSPGGSSVGPLMTAEKQNVLVIFVQFQDTPPGGPTDRLDLGTYYDNMLFGTTYDPPEYASYTGHPTDRTLKNYYGAVSYGKVDVVTLNMPSAQGWTKVDHPYSFYCHNDNGFGAFPGNAQGLVLDAVKKADSTVDFSKYAVDGEVPNLFVVFAGTGAEWSNDPQLIWSHSWSLDSYTGLTRDELQFDGVVVNNYAMMPEVGGDLTGYTGRVSGPFPPTVGVYAHEYGHVLGLPDQYDYGYESEGTSVYSLMAGGSWNQWPSNPIFSGNSPSFLDAWSRYRLGFANVVNVTTATSVTVLPAETDSTIYRMNVPGSGGKEYFLLENRQQIGFDEGLNIYGDSVVGPGVRGLAIYHVDDVIMSDPAAYWRPNEAENWKEFRSLGWQKASNGYTHYGISLIQADGRWDLEHGAYTGAGFLSDLYPGRNVVSLFGNSTLPNSSSYYFWLGNAPKFGYSGVTVSGIAESGQNIVANLSYEPAK